jgi:hypothetical protein
MWLASDYRQMAREVLEEVEMESDVHRKEALLRIAQLYGRAALTMEGSIRSSICG